MTDITQLSDQQLAALAAQAPASPPATAQAPVPPPDATITVVGKRPTDTPITTNPGADGSDISSLSNAQLQEMAANANPAMSGAEDAGRSFVTGLERGVGGLVALPQTVVDLEQKGIAKAAGMVSDFTGGNGQQTYDQFMAPKADLAFGIRGPTTAQADQAIQSVAGPYHTPQTTAGKYLESAGEFVPAAVAPGGLALRVARVVAPAVASQAAGDLSAGTAVEPYARFAGAMAGGLGVASAERMLSSAPRLAGRAMGNISDADINAAQALRQNAAGMGVDVTVPEAVQQVTQNGTNLGRMQRLVEGTSRGGQNLTPYFANRPGQIDQAVRNYADTLAPATSQPGIIGQDAQAAATGALNAARQTVNRAAQPQYAALSDQSIDPEQFSDLANNESYKQAMSAIRGNPVLNAPIKDLPDNNLAVVNEAVKQLDTMVEQAAGTPLAPGNRYLASLHGDARSLASDLASDASDGDGEPGSGPWSQARGTVADLSRRFVDPLNAGPLGKISSNADVGAQTRALYPSAPTEGASSETPVAIAALSQTSPSVAADLTRQHLINTFNEASQYLQPGPNQYGGAKFATQVAANPEQRATLLAGLDAVQPGAADRFSDLLDTLHATGKRQAQGSATAFNIDGLNEFKASKAGSFLKNLNIAEPFEGVGKALDAIGYRRNLDQLSQMMTAPPDQTAAILMAARHLDSGALAAYGIPAATSITNRPN